MDPARRRSDNPAGPKPARDSSWRKPRPTWTFLLSETGAQISPEKATKPCLRIIVGEDDWWQVAQGVVSPISLFMKGRMRFVGDCGIAQRAFVKLAGPGVAKL